MANLKLGGGRAAQFLERETVRYALFHGMPTKRSQFSCNYTLISLDSTDLTVADICAAANSQHAHIEC